MNWRERSQCGALGISDAGRVVKLMGWVDVLRDHGDALFIHLRDRSGIVQVVFSQGVSPKIFELAATLRSEFCVSVAGRVVKREESTKNPNIKTGDIEVMAGELEIISKSQTPPFIISEKAMVAGGEVKESEPVDEDLRLQYRYLDLRRPSMQNYLIMRYRIIKSVRNYLDSQDFIEMETPMLTKSTPEGARDYLVPSRIYPKRFFALPQSPQLFKQLLMISGFERYYQVVRCFRDEDLRPNRQPEFTQLDIEASFIDEEFIYEHTEEIVCRMFKEGGITLPRPFRQIKYSEAIDTTGSDRPDLRFDMKFIEATDIFRNTSYGIFKQIIERQGYIKGINVKGMSDKLSKNVLQNEYAKEIVPGFGAKGMTWMRVSNGKLESNIVQFFSKEEQSAVINRFKAENRDVILLIADPSYHVVTRALGMLRLHIAERFGLIPDNLYCPVWVTEFPLFEQTEESITSNHHPFTSPDRTDFDPHNIKELLTLKSRAYDIVVNGEELGGGSIRINDRELQNKIFKALGLSEKEAQGKFGFLLQALDFGAPPHGGIALGMDRVISMILKAPSIREVIAFPKNRSAFCPLTQAPSDVTKEQLSELGLFDLTAGEPIPGTEKKQSIVDYLSWVSRVAVNENEKPIIRSAIEDAKDMAKTVNENADDTEPAFGVVVVSNRSRKGGKPEVNSLSAKGDLLKNAPSVKGSYFKVPPVLE